MTDPRCISRGAEDTRHDRRSMDWQIPPMEYNGSRNPDSSTAVGHCDSIVAAEVEACPCITPERILEKPAVTFGT